MELLLQSGKRRRQNNKGGEREMAGKIKGITISLGADVQPLNKALEDVNKKTRDVQSELKQVDRLLKLDPKNTDLLAQRQKLLAEAVENSREKLDRLKTAQEQVNEQFRKGEINEEQYRAFQREVVKAEQELSKFEKQLKDTTATTKSWEQSLKKAGDGLKSAGQKMTDTGKNLSTKLTAPIVAAGGAIVALAVKAGQTADRLLDLSDITGLSTDTIQEYQYVANQAGVETEAMTAAVEGLVRKIPQLESEGGRATEQLAKLGISYERLKKMSPDQQIDLLITKLAEMRDPLERNAIGAQLFGGAWKDIAPILGMGADGIKAVREEAHDLGLVLDRDALEGANEFRKEMDRLKAILGGVINQLGARLAPILREQIAPIVENTIIPALQTLSDLIANIVEWFAGLSPEMQKVILALIALAIALGPILMPIGMLVSGIGALVKGISVAIGVLPKLGIAFAALTSPIGLTVIAITAAAVAIGYLIYQIVKNWDVIKAEFKRIFGAIADFFTKTVPRAINTGLKWLSELPGKVADIMLTVLNFFAQLPKKMFDIGANIVKGLWEGIKSMIEWIRNKISEFIESITGGIKSLLGIHSPSAVFADIGKNISLGLAQGIEKNRPAVSGAVTDTVNPQNITTREIIGRSGGDIFNITIDAKSVKQFNDIIRIAQDARRVRRMGLEPEGV